MKQAALAPHFRQRPMQRVSDWPRTGHSKQAWMTLQVRLANLPIAGQAVGRAASTQGLRGMESAAVARDEMGFPNFMLLSVRISGLAGTPPTAPAPIPLSSMNPMNPNQTLNPKPEPQTQTPYLKPGGPGQSAGLLGCGSVFGAGCASFLQMGSVSPRKEYPE